MNIVCGVYLLRNCFNCRLPDPSAFQHFVHSLLLADQIRPQQEVKTEPIALMTRCLNFQFFSILYSVMCTCTQPLLILAFFMLNSCRSNRDTNMKAGFVLGGAEKLKTDCTVCFIFFPFLQQNWQAVYAYFLTFHLVGKK